MHFEIQMLFFYFYFYYHVLYRRQNGVLASNSLHWILPRRQGVIAMNTILRFDLASEEFGVFSYPRDLCFEDNMDIGVLYGCLCLMGYTELTHVDVWIMKEYNLEGAWTKLFRMTKPESVESLDFMRPLLYSLDRSKILLEINIGKLMWFDSICTGQWWGWFSFQGIQAEVVSEAGELRIPNQHQGGGEGGKEMAFSNLIKS